MILPHYIEGNLMTGRSVEGRCRRPVHPLPTTTMTQGDGATSISRFPNMPAKTADYNQYWAYLSSAIDYILTNTGTNLSFADYTNITAVVYYYHTGYKTVRMIMSTPHSKSILLSHTICSFDVCSQLAPCHPNLVSTISSVTISFSIFRV